MCVYWFWGSLLAALLGILSYSGWWKLQWRATHLRGESMWSDPARQSDREQHQFLGTALSPRGIGPMAWCCVLLLGLLETTNLIDSRFIYIYIHIQYHAITYASYIHIILEERFNPINGRWLCIVRRTLVTHLHSSSLEPLPLLKFWSGTLNSARWFSNRGIFFLRHRRMFANHVQSTNVNLWLITPGQGLSNLGWHYIYI